MEKPANLRTDDFKDKLGRIKADELLSYAIGLTEQATVQTDDLDYIREVIGGPIDSLSQRMVGCALEYANRLLLEAEQNAGPYDTPLAEIDYANKVFIFKRLRVLQ